MNKSPDVAVVGLGVHGAATLYELARRGVRVRGIDALRPPHAAGSSHGRTRIIREAYFEHPLYVPFVQRAYDLWLEMQELTGTVLLRQTGALNVGPADGALVRGAQESARVHALPCDVLSADELRRFPALAVRDDHVGVHEPRAGVLLVEACVRTLLELAQGYGAEIRTDTRVTSWRADGDAVVLDVAGESVRAGAVVLAAGPWLNGVLASERAAVPLQLPLTVERQTTHWYSPPPETFHFRGAHLPVTLLEYARDHCVYTIPDVGHGVKAGIHHEGATFDPDTPSRDVTPDDEARVSHLLDSWMPELTGRHLAGLVCLYTNTPDGHFIIDRHPRSDRVFVVSACSGHGFKFAPAIGEAVADLVADGDTGWDLAPFTVQRFASQG